MLEGRIILCWRKITVSGDRTGRGGEFNPFDLDVKFLWDTEKFWPINRTGLWSSYFSTLAPFGRWISTPNSPASKLKSTSLKVVQGEKYPLIQHRKTSRETFVLLPKLACLSELHTCGTNFPTSFSFHVEIRQFLSTQREKFRMSVSCLALPNTQN